MIGLPQNCITFAYSQVICKYWIFFIESVNCCVVTIYFKRQCYLVFSHHATVNDLLPVKCSKTTKLQDQDHFFKTKTAFLKTIKLLMVMTS